MARMVMLQFLAVCCVAVFIALLGSVSAGVSALLGGLCYIVPNALFALQLYVNTKRPGGVSPVTFFIGEFSKISIAIVLLLSVVRVYPQLYWPTFLLGLVVGLKSYLILLIKKSLI